MTWVLAAVVVVLLTVVALVAVGRGGGLSETFDDRRDVRVPEGRLSGADVRRVRFTTAFRGYRMSEVDALLERVASQIEAEHLRDDGRPDDGLPDDAQPDDAQPDDPHPEA
jgi:DivIVA domain-containing protein